MLAVNKIEWKFNPPYGSHFGGAWERLIQIAKRTILSILGSKKLTPDLFNTILTETETMLNSWPLTNVADNTDNEEPLTPNHFLIQRPFSNLPPGTFDDRIPLRFENWSQQQLLNDIWRRLQKEYLPTLLKRTKWNFAEEPLKRGDVVLILNDRTPRGIWPLGRVTAEHPGRDGTTRVVTVRTAYGTFDRPASALALVFSFDSENTSTWAQLGAREHVAEAIFPHYDKSSNKSKIDSESHCDLWHTIEKLELRLRESCWLERLSLHLKTI